ncbi:integrase, partial [Solirubrobacter sp. CPCC 204708]|nr:integrase [Solirubrobacter deserti]
ITQQLTQPVLQEVEGIDHWTIYDALSKPLEGLGGRSPVDAVTHGTIDEVAEAVFNVLGVQVH